MKKKVFRSRVSFLLLVFIWGISLLSLIGKMDTISNSDVIIILPLFVFCTAFPFSLSYTVDADKLIGRTFGIKFYSVDITSIKAIRRSYNPLSSPAASLKRLEIKAPTRYGLPLLISPVREQEFLKTLKEINPSIEIKVKDKKSLFHFWNWDI